MKRIICTVGIQGSGKSTYARSILTPSTAIIERDTLRHRFQMTHYPEDYLDSGVNWEKWKWVDEKSISEIEFNLTKELLHDDDIDTIIICETHTSKSRRDSTVHWIKYHNVPVSIEWHFLDTDLEECIRRDSMRERPVGEKVIRNTHANLVSQADEENWIIVSSNKDATSSS